MKVVNKWTPNSGFKEARFLLPPVESVYSDMEGRVMMHPVMHKPPWNYVTYDAKGSFVEDNGGRDPEIMDVLAKKLNFTVVSVDPLAYGVKRSRGSVWQLPDYNFTGILGAIHQRKDPFHFYLGDNSQTYERLGVDCALP
jgi:glutamate receptor, ionotropic, invertebrate